ncbi:MAG: hypothetical protein JWQ32_126 [Marmoricola sp.]|nr:hypothetical protein [Marmoricola sp.]
MDGAMFAGVTLAAVGGAVVALLVVAIVARLRRRSSSRADLDAMLAAAQREADLLRARIEELTSDPGAATTAAGHAYVITDAGRGPREVALPGDQVGVPDRLVLSATMGEPLVKVAAFGHGVRRALSPESRNRIWFEMRREVRAARKRRRRLVREYLRDVRADDRARESLT